MSDAGMSVRFQRVVEDVATGGSRAEQWKRPVHVGTRVVLCWTL